MKKAIITGVTGQDGTYLACHLLKQGYEIWGGTRKKSLDQAWRLRELGIVDRVHVLQLDLIDASLVLKAIESVQPDEIYNLAGHSFVADSFDQPLYTTQVNAIGATHILEAIRETDTNIRFYQASSSEMYGNNGRMRQNETSHFVPLSPYASGKCFSHWMTVNYREAFNLYACSGILFNPESPLRDDRFVSRKITQGLARIKANQAPFLELGAIDVYRDWGHAEDYVRGMHLMLQQSSPDDYVIASGECHSVREFVDIAAMSCGWCPQWIGEGLNETCIDQQSGNQLVRINPNYMRSWDMRRISGDPAKAKSKLGWKPKFNFQTLVSEMMEHDLRNFSKNT